MHGVMTTPLAILLQLDTLRIILLVLLGRIVAALAFRACQNYLRTHENSPNNYNKIEKTLKSQHTNYFMNGARKKRAPS